MIEKILIEINRLKNELDGYSAREALDYIESYINTLSKQDMESYEKIKKVLALGFMNFLDDNKSKGKMCLSNGECEDIEKAFNEQDWAKLTRYLDKYIMSEDEKVRQQPVTLVEQFLDTLESEKPMNPNDAMKELDEKIALVKQRGTWDGVDVDKYMDEVRGREPEKPCHTVEEWMEHIKNADALTKAIFSKGPYNVLYDALNRPYRDCYDAIKEFGELCYQTARQDMMKEAVEGKIIFLLSGDVAVNIGDTDEYKLGQKVRVIICKKED